MVLFNTNAMAQYSLSGNITDMTSNQGLYGANVILKVNKIKVTPTNNQGYFEFTDLAKGEYVLEVSFVGYQIYKRTITIPTTENLIIKLEEDPYLPDAITVMATRAGENAPLSYSEINKKELEAVNMGKDMPYLLESMPDRKSVV